MKKSPLLSLLALAAGLSLATAEEGFVELFNGKNLDG